MCEWIGREDPDRPPEERLGRAEGGAGRLPEAVAEKLTPGARVGLEDPIRRMILRRLRMLGCEQSSSQLTAAAELPSEVSRVGYHAIVLRRCGLLREVAGEEPRPSLRRFCLSAAAQEPLVLSALQATEALDLELGKPGGADPEARPPTGAGPRGTW